MVGLAPGLNIRRPNEIMAESLQNPGGRGGLSESSWLIHRRHHMAQQYSRKLALYRCWLL